MSGRRRKLVVQLLLGALCCILGWNAPSSSLAQDGAPGDPIQIAFFVPQLDFAGSLERSSWCDSLARHLAETTGLAVDAKGFARAADFRAFVRRSGTPLVVVGAQLGLKAGWRPLLQAVGPGGSPTQPMALVSRQATSIPELKGRSLMLTSTGGGEETLVQALVLAGELAPAKFFGKVLQAPDAASAAAAVALGKADAAFVPSSVARARSLPVVFESSGVPLPLMMEVDDKLPESVKTRLLMAMSAAPDGGGIRGWRTPDGGLLSRFGARLGRRSSRQLVPASTGWVPLRTDSGEAMHQDDGLGLEPLPVDELWEPAALELEVDLYPRGQAPLSEEPEEDEP